MSDGAAGDLEVLPDLVIPEAEIAVVTSRSSGPGGQNVNKVETRATVVFDVAGSATLSDEQREKIRERLATRTTKAGLLRVSAQRERSQAGNRAAARERLAELLREALSDDPERRPTKVPRRQKRRRLQGKRQRSEIKRLRSRLPEE